MFTVKLADLIIAIDNQFDYIKNLCIDYITDECSVDFSVTANVDEIIAEQTGNFDLEYLETLALYRKIAEKILEYDGFLMHGVLMECFDKGIMICAKSGIGKSTHAKLWRDVVGNNCKIINGDKPLIRITSNGVIAYGTPWAGKENFNINKSVKLTDICFLERASENKVEAVKGDMIKLLFEQIYFPKNNKIIKIVELIDVFANNTKQWKILCNQDISAARTVMDKLWEYKKH